MLIILSIIVGSIFVLIFTILNTMKLSSHSRQIGMLELKIIELTKQQRQLSREEDDIFDQETSRPEAPPTPAPDIVDTKGTPPPAKDEEIVPPPTPPTPTNSNVPQSAIPERRDNGSAVLDIETKFGTRWLVWIGGVALALGGIFMVKYSVEHGLLGPWGRVISGISTGLVMLLAGEWLRRQPEAFAFAKDWQHLPLAVSGAGITTLFGSVFAGYAMYDLFEPVITFPLLALVSASAVLLSILHGPILATIGLIGAYSVPALVSSSTPSSPMLFAYLILFASGSLTLFRYKAWNWLAWGNLAGCLIWAFLWITSFLNLEIDILSTEAFLSAVFGLFIYYSWDEKEPDPESFWAFCVSSHYSPRQLATLGAALSVSALSLFLAVEINHAPSSIFTVLVLSLAYIYTARINPALDLLAVFSLGAMLTLIATWDFPPELATRIPRYYGNLRSGFEVTNLADGLEWFVATTGLVAAVHLVASSWFAQTAKRPGLWSAQAVIAPLSAFAIAYWKINGLKTIPEWSLLALFLGIIYTALSYSTLRKRQQAGQEAALAAYVIGGFASISLVLGAALEDHWLSISLALILPALAWVNNRIKLTALRLFAYPFAAIVLVRLMLESEILGYFMSPKGAIDWYVYGYGIPVAAFALAAYWYRKDKTDRLISLLETGALMFWITLLSLSIRHMTGLDILPAVEIAGLFGYGLAEQSLHSALWLINGLGLYWLNKRTPSAVRNIGWKVLAGAAAAQVLLIQCLSGNPWFSVADNIGSWPILSWLLMAYAIPAALAMVYRKILSQEGYITLARYCGIASFGLLFLSITMEIRHLFTGPVLHGFPVTDPELYTYSIVWLILGGLLMAGAIWKKNDDLRKGSLAVLLITVCKVFLYDMSALEGLLRATSFLGLGASLIAIGFIYQRFVMKPEGNQERLS